MSRFGTIWLALALLASPCFADGVSHLIDVLSVEQITGQGTLEYTQGANAEKITLGDPAGRYGYGMIFNGSMLPASVVSKFHHKHVLQFALGTVRAKVGKQVSQFASIAILTSHLPVKKTLYRLVVPTGKESPLSEMALMMFMAPEAMAQTSDEEKLRSTYFADTGSLSLEPQGEAKAVQVPTENGKLDFMMRMMKMRIETTLITPFNAQENVLDGEITVPLYWPKSKEAEHFMDSIAHESLVGAAPVPMPLPPPSK